MKEKNNEQENLNKEESFAKYIYELRLKRNLTQKMLADKIKVSDRTISKWENGLTVPDLHNIRVICKELGVSADSVVLEKNTFKDHFHNFLGLLKILWKHIFNNIFKVIFFILFILLLIYFINNYNAINIYTMKYESKDITIGNGYFIKSKARNILMIDNIKILDELDENVEYKLILYTLVNGDKFIIYEDETLEDIFIEELDGYPDKLQKDVIRAMKKGLYIDIIVNDNKTYKCSITLKEYFSNNKLAYRNYQINTDYNNDYQMFLNSKDELTNNTTEYKNFAADFNTYNTPKVNSKIVNKDSNNKLESLGYSYDDETDTYTKVEGDKEIIYQPAMNFVYIKENNKKTKKNIYYYIEKDKIYLEYYDENNYLFTKLKYLTTVNKLVCFVGNCKNYQSEIDYILAEYQKIFAIL